MRAIEVWKNMTRRRVRRPLIGGFTLLLAAALAFPVLAVVFPDASQTKRERQAARGEAPNVVFTNPATITINDAPAVGVSNPYPSTINVSGMTGTITKVTVTLSNFNHTFPDDMDILLVGPTGTNVVIMSDAAGSFDTVNAYFTFDDDAAGPMTTDGPTGSGTFNVSQFVAGDVYPAPAPAPSANTTLGAAFNGIDPNGAWSLFLVDDTGVDQGVIGNGWGLNITTTASPFPTAFSSTAHIFMNDRFAKASPYPSTINVTGITGRITDVNVTLTNINHLNPDDIDIVLVSPSGRRIVMLSDTGGTTDVINQTLTFDDSAAATIPDAGPMVSGTFRPSNFGSGDNMQDLLPPYGNASSAGPATLASTFNGTDPNGIWSLYVIDDATNSVGTIAGGWSIDILGGGGGGARRFTNADFDGDATTDTSVFDYATGNWYTRDSRTYFNRTQINWGTTGDILVPGDYDNDRKTDYAVWRPSEGNWYIVNSGTGVPTVFNWGTMGDIPVPADYNGDGDIDVAVFRPSEGNWYIPGMPVVGWGTAGDIPVTGYFTGSDAADYCVFRPSEGNWYIRDAAGMIVTVTNWGTASDTLVPGDYDADGRTDIAVWRPSNANWYVILSSTGGVLLRSWGGVAGDVPVPGDYDGDGRTDIAIWRPSEGIWYILSSGTTPNSQRIDQLGLSTEVPVPSVY